MTITFFCPVFFLNLKRDLFLFVWVFCLHVYFTFMCVCALCLCLLPMEARRGHGISWDWQWHPTRMLGIEPMSFGTIVSALIHGTNSLVPWLWFFFLKHYFCIRSLKNSYNMFLLILPAPLALPRSTPPIPSLKEHIKARLCFPAILGCVVFTGLPLAYQAYTFRENWFSSFQKLSVTNSYLARGEISCSPYPPAPISMLGVDLAWAIMLS